MYAKCFMTNGGTWAAKRHVYVFISNILLRP